MSRDIFACQTRRQRAAAKNSLSQLKILYRARSARPFGNWCLAYSRAKANVARNVRAIFSRAVGTGGCRRSEEFFVHTLRTRADFLDVDRPNLANVSSLLGVCGLPNVTENVE